MQREITEEVNMKGYDTYAGFMGYVDGEYMLFASDEEYYVYMEEE